MGRGRAKAKQTKKARELKYSTSGTDLERLRRELSGEPPAAAPTPRSPALPRTAVVDPDSEDEDVFDDYAARYGAIEGDETDDGADDGADDPEDTSLLR